MVTDRPPVMIVGAGVGGLTLALLLRRQGIRAEVLEQSAELREVGAAVALAANGTRVLAYLGLADALVREGTEPTALIHRDVTKPALLEVRLEGRFVVVAAVHASSPLNRTRAWPAHMRERINIHSQYPVWSRIWQERQRKSESRN